MLYLFEDCALDTDRRELRRRLEAVPIEPQVFDLLVYLIRNRERVVSRDDLIAAIWAGRIVSESTLNTRISSARFAIGDNGEDQRLIKTFPRRGIRFVGAVREQSEGAAEEKRDGGATDETRPSRSYLSRAAVLPGARPAGWRGTVIDIGAWLRTPQFFQAHKLRMWSAGVVMFFCIGGVATYLIARWAVEPPANSMHAGPRAAATVAWKPHLTFKDCDVCPEMVALPTGEYMMGSTQDDPDRQQVEGPSRRVVITRPFAIGRFEITVDEFTAFVAATAMTMNSTFNKCAVILSVDVDPPTWMQSENASFRRPGVDVTGAHPAGCVSWYDAQAYVAWLRRRTGKPYRLPTEVEWEYAARAGTTTKFNFGDDERLLCDYARFADLTSHYTWRDSCRSGMTADGPIQVGKLKPNAWGIFDMHGNVWEWVEDCWTPNWTEIPTDGSAYARPGNCEMGVIRGGSWISPSRRLRTAFRTKSLTPLQGQIIGFRVALTLGAP